MRTQIATNMKTYNSIIATIDLNITNVDSDIAKNQF